MMTPTRVNARVPPTPGYTSDIAAWRIRYDADTSTAASTAKTPAAVSASCRRVSRTRRTSRAWARSSLMDVTGTLRDWTAYGYRYVVTVTTPTPRLDIRLLGPPEILVDGAPLVVDTRKAVAILALLGAE